MKQKAIFVILKETKRGICIMSSTENLELTQQYITDALFYFMKKKPYEKISVTEITQKAGVGRVTYYRHFQSKDDILIQYFKKQMKSNTAIFYFTPKSKEDYYEIIFTILTRFKEKKELMKLIQQAHLEHIYLKFLNKAMIENYRLHNRKPSEYAPYYFAGCLFNISMEWLKKDCKDSVKKVSDEYFRCLFSNFEE